MLEQITTSVEEERVDAMFMKLIEEISSYAMKLNIIEERQVVAAWIKKLCHRPLMSSIIERKNRNLYAQILQKMLQKNNLREPFNMKPNAGKLPTIPVYLSNYLDDDSDSFCMSTKVGDCGPEWLQGKEFEDSVLLLQSIIYENEPENKNEYIFENREDFMLSPTLDDSYNIPYPTMRDQHQRDFLQMPEANELEFFLKSQENISDKKCPDDNVDGNQLNLYYRNLEIAHKNSTSDKDEWYHRSSKEKELETKLEFLEKKIEEESLRIQQQQDVMVKNILDRKNSEVTDIKRCYQKKVSESEVVIKTRDETVSKLKAECKEMQTLHKQAIDDLKNAIHRNEDGKISKLENEMSSLQKSHKQNIEELNQENIKLLSARKDLVDENKNLNASIEDLAEKLESLNKMKDKITHERNTLKKKEEEYLCQINTSQLEVMEKNTEVTNLEKENIRLVDEHERVLSELRQTSEKAFNDLKKDKLLCSSKSNSMIAELESKIFHCQQALQDLELTRDCEIKELQTIHKQELIGLDSSMNKKIQIQRSDYEARELGYKDLIAKYELSSKEKEKEIQNLEVKLKEHTKESEFAIEQLKNQSEKNASRMFQELNGKLAQLQLALTSAKHEVEREKNNTSHRLAQQKSKYEMQHSKHKMEMEQVQSKLQKKYDIEITEHAEALSKQRLEHVEKLKGLLPLSIKKELEDRIESMAQQIVMLQSQVDLLQEELNSSIAYNLSRKTNTN